MKTALLKQALHALNWIGAPSWAPAALRGNGAIFMLHRVRAAPLPDFAPNRILEITPDMLDRVLHRVRDLDYDIVTLDEAMHRLRHGAKRRFAVFTFDDGYKDNLTEALPVFEKHGAPMTVYVSAGMPDGTMEIWWVALEEIIRKADHLETELGGRHISMPAKTARQMELAFARLYWPLRAMDEDALRAAIRQLAAQHGISVPKITEESALSWEDVKTLHAHPLVTVGSHTVDHFALCKVSEERARMEMKRGAEAIASHTGEMPRHFAYPFGDASSAGEREFRLARELGFETATTTRKGLIFEQHQDQMTALPRISLNGDYQDIRLVDVLMSGVPFPFARLFPSLGVA